MCPFHMENTTSPLDVHILPFFMKTDNKLLIFSTVYFSFIYSFGLLVNTVIIAVICLNPHLHTPMYLFLCNLSVVDICYTTVIIPKLLYILLSGNNSVPFTQCFIQIYFMLLAASVEVNILFIMAYDRYVAICHPLHYHRILKKKICILLIIVIWIGGSVNSSFFTSSILKIIFCSSVTIHQIFCDAKALVNKSCGGTEMFYIVLYAECLSFGFCPVMCNLMSYVKIIRVIQRIKSKDGRSKAFSTCSSHLIVMAIYYGSVLSVYLTPPSDRYDLLEQILTMFYTIVVPMLNPLIYSLRNNEVKSSLWKLML
ncbi:olfactory receptor 8D1-like [Rana temporaria]|uniref:olfactory receptor 8D1-like n=1 Tax=Rana temporaria TaxID=8407 RepID=UPI001AAC54FC|nr:olfactory receptor 8D1-like [Rana temporaria]